MDGLGAGSTLSGIVDDVTFANISRRELKSAGYDAAENLVKLLQLCVEYMLHVQESLISDASKAELGRRKALDETANVEAKLSLEKARRRAAARQCVDFREVALALAGAARAAGVDTARWIDSLRDGEAANDESGYSVSLSADGGTVAIGAPYAWPAGRVAVYQLSLEGHEEVWKQLGRSLHGKAAGDRFGYSVSLASGPRVAVSTSPIHTAAHTFYPAVVSVYEFGGAGRAVFCVRCCDAVRCGV